MFKIGDKVICIDIDDNVHKILELNGIYTILSAEDWFVKLYEIKDYFYDHMRFISLKEQRKQKIQEICSEKVIK